MVKLHNILVYEWNAWGGFLISHLVDDRLRCTAQYEDDFESIVSRFPSNYTALLPQINLSDSRCFPRARQEIFEKFRRFGIHVLNSNVDNITKSNLHTLLQLSGARSAKANQHGIPEELLFVKTNLNWGGELERRVNNETWRAVKGELLATRICRHDQYYTVARKNVEDVVWNDQSLVVEKYISNEEQSFYRVYGLGNAVIVVKAHAHGDVKKISGYPNDVNYFCTRDEIFRQVAEINYDLQRQISLFLLYTGLDYFCLDVVHNNIKHYIIDLNLTPYSGLDAQNEDVIQFMIQGVSNSFECESNDKNFISSNCSL